MNFLSEKNKPIILVFPFDVMSHYLRCITFVQRYSGYRIIFLSSNKYNGFIKLAGHETFEAETFDSKKAMADTERFKFNWLNQTEINRVASSHANIIKSYQPSFVIGDTYPTLKIACQLANTKYISLFNGYMSKYLDCNRALSQKHWLFKNINKLPDKLKFKLLEIGEPYVFRYLQKPFNEVRKNKNIPLLQNYLDEMEGDENYICDSLDVFPQKNVPQNYTILGPLFYQNNQGEQNIIQKLDAEKETICVCMGSSGNWDELTFLSEKKYAKYNIITAGDSNRCVQGSHVISQDFINLDAILPYCNYVICHGGNGTIYQALKHKVFVFCIPTHFEQEWNADRIEKLGLGKNIAQKPKAKLQKLLLT